MRAVNGVPAPLYRHNPLTSLWKLQALHQHRCQGSLDLHDFEIAQPQWCSLNQVPGLEIGIQQYAEDACRIHHRGRGEGMMGEP